MTAPNIPAPALECIWDYHMNNNFHSSNYGLLCCKIEESQSVGWPQMGMETSSLKDSPAGFREVSCHVVRGSRIARI